jgi:tetratricopeptide (TPR) repeat protein
VISKTISGFIAIVFIFSLALFGFQKILVVGEQNIWSLNYARLTIQHKEIPLNFPKYPPDHQRAPIWLARNAVQRGDYGEAFQYITPLVLQGNKDALVVKGETLAAEGKVKDAIDAWSQAGEFQLLLNVAQKSLDNKHLENALLAYRAAWELNPNVSTLPLANFLYWHYNSQDEAESLLQEEISRYPASSYRADWLTTLGDYFVRQKRWDKAQAVYQQLLKETSFFTQAHIGLGWVYYGRGDGVNAAMTEFEKVIETSPESGEGYYNIAQLLVLEKRYTEADGWYIKALDRDPGMQIWYIVRGNAARESGNYSLAIQIYQDTALKFPNWSRVYYELAWAYRLNEKPENAKVSIEQALKLLNSPDPLYFIRAGQIYEWVGDMQMALTDYQKALTLDSANKAAQSGIKRLMTAKPENQK